MTDWHPVGNAHPREWVLANGEYGEPYGVVRRLEFRGVHGRQVWFRAVTWSQHSEDRQLLGYFTSLEDAAAFCWTHLLERNRAIRQAQAGDHNVPDIDPVGWGRR